MDDIKKIDWKSPISWIILFIPLITGFLTGSLCKMSKDSGEKIKARPPSYVFGIAWTILYLLIGVSWLILRNVDKKIDILFGAITLCLILWIVMYSCKKNKKGALYILLITYILSLMAFSYGWKNSIMSGFLLSPYVGWLSFALMLNFADVNMS